MKTNIANLIGVIAMMTNISFGQTIEEFTSVIDNRPLVRQSYGIRVARALSDKQVELTIGHSTSSAIESEKSYRIISFEDLNYAYEKFVKPVACEFKVEQEIKGVPGGAFEKYSKTTVVLTLPFPLNEGKEYHILGQGINGNMVTAAKTAATFTYDGKAGEVPNTKDLAMAVLGLRRMEPVGEGIVMLEFGADLVTNQVTTVDNYSFMINAQSVSIANIGRRTMVETYLPVGWPFKAFPVHQVFIELNTPYKTGDTISVELGKKLTNANRKASIIFKDTATFSNSIRVNQMGYITQSPVKMAYLGRWMGSFPETLKGIKVSAKATTAKKKIISYPDKFNKALLAAENQTDKIYQSDSKSVKQTNDNAYNPALWFKGAPNFNICEEKTGEIVYTGKAQLVHTSGDMNEGFYQVDHSGENVYHLDFTDFQKAGTYFISVKGVGRSLPFQIADNVFNQPFQVISNGLFKQRCGIKLEPPYSNWHRIACHTDGVTPTTIKHLEKHKWSELAYNVDYDRVKGAPIDPSLQKLNEDPSLVAHWTLDGNFKDRSGNNKHLKPKVSKQKFFLSRQTLPGENKAWGPVSQDASGGAVSPVLDIDIDKGLTISGWFQYQKTNNFNGILFGFGEQGWDKPKLLIEAGWGVLSAIGGATGKAIRWKRLGDGKWHLITIVVSPNKDGEQLITLYGNGEKVGTIAVNGDTATNLPFNLATINGKEVEGKSYDDFRIYNRSLNSDEISTLAQKWGDKAVSIMTCGGHHDAGDYNPRSHIRVCQSLMDVYEMKPNNFWDKQLNIPESGNGIPDVLDEAFWGLQLWRDLQDQDGGVFNGTESNGDPNFIQSVELDTLGDYTYAKDTNGSLIFAGAFAQASRIWKSIGQTKQADDFLARAIKVYEWAQQNKATNYVSPKAYAINWQDPMAYAAAQLFHTTGKQIYKDDFASVAVWQTREDADLDIHMLYNQKKAAWAYINAPKADPILKEKIRDAIIKNADWTIQYSSSMAYGFLRHPHAPITWGTGAVATWVNQVMWAYELTGDTKYLTWLIRTSDNILGSNPINRSYIVGAGPRTVRAPLHNSRYGHTGEVVSGQVVQGPNQRGEGYRVLEVAYPKIREDFASLYTFSDSHFCIAMDEGGSVIQANIMALFGYLLSDKN